MRRMVLLLVVGLMVWPATLWPARAQDGDPVLYTTADGTFEFAYPANWVTNDDTAGQVLLAPTEEILFKAVEEFVSGDVRFQILSPQFTDQFSDGRAGNAVELLTVVQGRLSDDWVPVGEVAPTTYGDYDAARLDLTVLTLDVSIIGVELQGGQLSLVFAFALQGERNLLDVPITDIVSSMRFVQRDINLGEYAPMTTANAADLDNVVIWGDHTAGVRNVAISPDSTLVASTDNNSIVIVRDVASGEPVTVLASERVISAGPVFSPDGQYLLFGSPSGEVWQWDIAQNQLAGEWGPVGGTVWDVAYSPNGQTIAAASADLTVRVWRANDNQALSILTGHRNDVVSVAYDSSGEFVVTASLDGTVRLWDIKEGVAVMTLLGPSQGMTTAAITPDNLLIAGGSVSGSLHVWDVPTQLERYNFAAEEASVEAITAVTFNADGSLMAASREDGSVRVWQSNSGRPITALGGATILNDLTFSPDGRLLVAADESGVLLVWGIRVE